MNAITNVYSLPGGLVSHRRIRQLGVLALLALVASGCGEPAPEVQLEAAGEALGEATNELGDINKQIDEIEATLDRLRAERRKQKDRVHTLEQRLTARATDVAIFRAVQTALLDDASLEDTAITVMVEDSVVTLAGAVNAREQSRQANMLANNVAGVATVVSRLQVSDLQNSKSNED